jgi:hypothetical protein
MRTGKIFAKAWWTTSFLLFILRFQSSGQSKIGIRVVKAADLAGLCQKPLVSVETQGRASAFILHG